MIYLSSPANENSVKLTVQFPVELTDLHGKLRKKFPAMVRRIAIEAKTFWKTEAGRRLRASRNAYQSAISVDIQDTGFSLNLSGFLAYSVEEGNKGFNMKEGLLKNATLHSPRVGRYRVIPMNPNHYVNMTRPTEFAVVSDASKGWNHPGWPRPMKIAETVVNELDKRIIPKHFAELMKGLK